MLLNLFNNQFLFYIFVGIILTWLVILSVFLIKAVHHYRFLISKVKKGDLKSVLEGILSRVEKQGEKIDNLEQKSLEIEKKSEKYLQKIGFLRFNPFSDTGGDQSFCLGLLDEADSGIILSSLHSRGQTRVYAKAVKKGKGKELEFSKEELETINMAKKER